MARLNRDVVYVTFPFRVGKDGVRASTRASHVREQIEQVLHTIPGERIFRPQFGAGVRALVFEPNGSALRELARKRLEASLSEALRGEVDPKSLKVEVEIREETVIANIEYTLASIGKLESHRFVLEGGGGSIG